MNVGIASITAALACAALPVPAQHPHAHGAHAASRPSAGAHERPAGQSPYSAFGARDIKAFSEQQSADLLAGAGMSLALPAELNGYPGPAHVLELAGPLRLSAEQKAWTERLIASMRAEAKAAGEVVIDAERALDRLFRERRATDEAVSTAAFAAARAQAALRETHLRYHLRMMDVLAPEQVARYRSLRGY